MSEGPAKAGTSEESQMDRVTKELAALRAAMADARSEHEQSVDGAVERLLNAIEFQERAGPEPSEPPPHTCDVPPVVRIRHARHQSS